MLSAIAVLAAAVVFFLTMIPGVFMTLRGRGKMRRTGATPGRQWKAWSIGALPTCVLWIILMGATVEFSPEGSGPPTEQDWLNLFQLFAMAGALPGIGLFFGGLSQGFHSRSEG